MIFNLKTPDNYFFLDPDMRLKHLISPLLLIPFLTYAQNAFINRGVNIYIQEKGLLERQGNFLNDSRTNAVNNDGTIEVTGNFNNVTGATFGVYNNSASTERVVKFTGNGNS